MRKLAFILVVALQLVALKGWAQVQGTFHYTASINWPASDSVFRSWNITMFTNDTISRVDTETGQFGTQIYIRHIALKKAYLLLDVDGKKYAIQTDLERNKSTDTMEVAYTFKKKLFGKKINGIKCRKYYIVDKGQKEGYFGYFAKNIPNKYLEVYGVIPGLAIDYYLPSADGLTHYQLDKYSLEPVSRDLFGIPSDYQKISFEDFVNQFQDAY